MVDTGLDLSRIAAPTTVDKNEFIRVVYPVKTTAELASATDRINLVDKFLGKPVFNSTIGLVVYAGGALVADAWVAGSDFGISASAGIADFADAYGSSVVRSGGIVKTTILIDLDGLEGGGAGDIIGDATPSISHLGQFTAARNGTILYGTITCIETPAGGSTDIDFTSADEGTGVQDTTIASLSNLQVLLDTGDWSGGVVFELMTGLPAADQYLYMVGVGADAVEYSAGIFLLEFYGV